MPAQPAPPPPGYAYPPPPPGYVYLPPGYVYPPPPPLAPSGQRLAEFVDRLVARLIDGAILGGVTVLVIVPIYVITIVLIFNRFDETIITVDRQTSDPPTTLTLAELGPILLPLLALSVLAILLSLAIAYLYEVQMMFRTGQTIGKRIMKIQVVPIDAEQSLTRRQAERRFLVEHVAAAVVPMLNVIDGLWQLWDKPYRQCLHDKFANTVVIKLGP